MAKSDIVVKIIYAPDESGLKKSQKQVKSFVASVQGIGKAVISSFGAFAAFDSVSSIVSNAVQANVRFEKSLSEMSSLTGAVGEDLEYYKKQAIQLGSAAGMSASDVVKAFQLVGGQRPELLKNKEALVEVTQAAITLSHASGEDLESSARALTMSLGQMGASSSDASNYINILAAASQEGAAEIPYLNMAIEKAGGTANLVGLSFAQLVASIEAVAPKVSDAGTAGIGLRNILIMLEKQTNDNLKPSVVGYNQALTNLADSNLTITQLTKMFGAENVAVAQALISAKDECIRLQGAIVGTNTAQEQAKINNDNVAGAVERLSAAWEGFTLNLSKSNGAIKGAINWLTQMINRASQLFVTVQQLNNELSSEQNDKSIKQANQRVERRVSGGMSRQQAVSSELAYQRKLYAQAQEEINKYNQTYSPRQRLANQNSYMLAAGATKNGMAATNWFMNGLTFGARSRQSNAYEGYLNALFRRRAAGRTIYALKNPQSTGSVQVEAPSTPSASGVSTVGSGKTASKSISKRYEEGSIGALERKLNDLQEQYRSVTTDAARTQIGAQIAAAEAQRDAMQAASKVTAKEGSLDYYEQRISELKTKLGQATTDSVRKEINEQINVLEQAVTDINKTLEKKVPEGSYAAMDEAINRLKDELDNATTDAARREISGKIEQMQSTRQTAEKEQGYTGPFSDAKRRADQYDEAMSKVQEYDRLLKAANQSEKAQLKQIRDEWQRTADAIGGAADKMNGLSIAQQAANQFLQLGGAVQQMGSVLGVNMDGFSKFMSVLQATMSVISAVQSITEFFGGTLGQLDGSTANVTESNKQEATSGAAAAVASGVKSGAYLLEAKAAEKAAAANIFLAHSYIPFAGVPMATGYVTAMEGVLNGMQMFAEGGIVGGSSYSGDRVIARLNSGEMVINRGDQRRLFGMIKSGNSGNTGQSITRTVVTGEQIVTAVNNYSRRRGRGEAIKI